MDYINYNQPNKFTHISFPIKNIRDLIVLSNYSYSYHNKIVIDFIENFTFIFYTYVHIKWINNILLNLSVHLSAQPEIIKEDPKIDFGKKKYITYNLIIL